MKILLDAEKFFPFLPILLILAGIIINKIVEIKSKNNNKEEKINRPSQKLWFQNRPDPPSEYDQNSSTFLSKNNIENPLREIQKTASLAQKGTPLRDINKIDLSGEYEEYINSGCYRDQQPAKLIKKKSKAFWDKTQKPIKKLKVSSYDIHTEKPFDEIIILTSKDKLREAVIFSEILSKPKALSNDLFF